MNTLYGIVNCGTMKKARAWLDGHCVAYAFHDYKKAGLEESLARAWVDELGWESIINRNGTTWRKLPESVRASVDAQSAIRLMVENPSIVRRPLLDTGDARHLGFSESQYEALFNSCHPPSSSPGS
jgi:arsenate reductase (glutaredoxin)